MTPDSIRAERDETLLVIHRLPLIDMMEITAQSLQRQLLGLWLHVFDGLTLRQWECHEITMKSPWATHFWLLESHEITMKSPMKSSHCCWLSPCQASRTYPWTEAGPKSRYRPQEGWIWKGSSGGWNWDLEGGVHQIDNQLNYGLWQL